jgi:hypothetical protein
MSSLIDLPPGEDEDDAHSERAARSRHRRRGVFRFLIAALAGISISSALAGTITIGGGESFELGRRTFNVGSCAENSVRIDVKVEEVGGTKYLSQFTVSGIDPFRCDGRVVKLRPFDTSNNPIKFIDINGNALPDLAVLEVFISGREFRTSSGGVLSDSTTALLTQTTGSPRLRLSTLQSESTTVHLFSGGLGRTLKSSEDALAGLGIAFQARIQPRVEIVGYGRTDIEILQLGP